MDGVLYRNESVSLPSSRSAVRAFGRSGVPRMHWPLAVGEASAKEKVKVDAAVLASWSPGLWPEPCGPPDLRLWTEGG